MSSHGHGVADLVRRLPRGWRRPAIQKLRIVFERIRRLSAKTPAEFRRRLRLTPLDQVTLGDRLTDWQKRDFAALDDAWTRLAKIGPTDDRPVVRRAYLERPRGHSKTTDLAVQLAWLLRFSPVRLRGVVAAADREQAKLLKDALAGIAAANPQWLGQLKFRADSVGNPITGSEATFLASHVASSYGLTPDFVVCDELCHWTKEEFWQSLVSAAGKRPDCVLVVLSNAGSGHDWRWDAREAARLGATADTQSPTWHFSTLDGPQAPWVTEESLAEQRRLLPTAVFERLWLNRWQQAEGSLFTPTEVEACVDDSLAERDVGTPGVRYVAAADYAEKHDLTACVVLHQEPTEDGGDRIVIDRLDVFVPTPEKPTPVRVVRDWIVRTAAAFGDVRFVVDEFQLAGMVQELEPSLDVSRFEFASGRGNHELALRLRRAVAETRLIWPPGCGARPDRPDDDLAAELIALKMIERPNGRVRIDHDRLGHDDRAFAVGAALVELGRTDTTSAPETLEIEQGRLLD